MAPNKRTAIVGSKLVHQQAKVGDILPQDDSEAHLQWDAAMEPTKSVAEGLALNRTDALGVLKHNFDPKLVKAEEDGDGVLWFSYDKHGKISPWHDIPLLSNDSTGFEDPVFHMVVEIPLATNEKFEIMNNKDMNPLAQEIKSDGTKRSYKYQPDIGSLTNYGSLVQSWSNPREQDPWVKSGLLGDGDPVDVCLISRKGKARKRGAVVPIRIFGALALLDQGEVDWKLLALEAASEPQPLVTPLPKDVLDKVTAIRKWFKVYKTAEGKQENVLAFDGKMQDRFTANKVAFHSHVSWRKLHGWNQEQKTWRHPRKSQREKQDDSLVKGAEMEKALSRMIWPGKQKEGMLTIAEAMTTLIDPATSRHGHFTLPNDPYKAQEESEEEADDDDEILPGQLNIDLPTDKDGRKLQGVVPDEESDGYESDDESSETGANGCFFPCIRRRRR